MHKRKLHIFIKKQSFIFQEKNPSSGNNGIVLFLQIPSVLGLSELKLLFVSAWVYSVRLLCLGSN